MNKNYKIELSKEEALVIFAFLSRYEDSNQLEIKDQSEQRALWNLQCLLEKELPEPFNESYVKELEQARDKLRDKNEKKID